MNQFILKILSFLLVIFFSIFLFEVSVATYVSNMASFKFKPTTKYIIFGSSVSTCAYNDSIIENFVNLSDLGEPYFYSFYKIKEVIQQNKSLNAIFLEFSNGNIDKHKMAGRIWDDENMRYRYPFLASFISYEDQLLLIRKNFETYFEIQGISSKIRISKILRHDLDFTKNIGHFRQLKRNFSDSDNSNYDSLKFLDLDNKYEISSINLHYLDEIVSLCQVHGVRIIFIRTPQYVFYPLKKNELFFQKILKTRYSIVEFLDLYNFKLKNNEIADVEHLNYRGANRFSTWFNDLIESGILDQQIDQSLVNNEIARENSINGFEQHIRYN